MFGAISCRFTVEYVACCGVGIRMISQVSYGSSNQSTLPETYYQF